MQKSISRLPSITMLSLLLAAFACGSADGRNNPNAEKPSTTLDAAEEIHLLFMRAEEKLAHDVYVYFGERWPDVSVFRNIVDSETNHQSAMLDKLEQYSLDDPNADDAAGEFAEDNYGDYFTAKYNALTNLTDEENELRTALKNGALIEELDMHDIVECPVIIVDTEDFIQSEEECGMEYTDEKALLNSYENLLEGSKNHLRAFVRVLEATFPDEYPYQAQYLSQEEVDEILGRQ